MSGLRSGIGFVLIGTSVAASLVPSSARAACGGGGMSAPSAPPSVGPLNGGVETAAATSDPAIAKAQKHFIAGGKAYNAADYSTAEHEFKQAESMTVKYSSPALDRQLGQTNEKLKRPRVAIKYYQRFIVQHFWGTEADEVNARISALETETASLRTAPSAVEAAAMPPTSQTEWIGYDPFDGAPPKTVVASRPMPKYWWVSLVAVGGAAIVVGAGMAIANHVKSDSGNVTATGVGAVIHF